MKRIFLLAAFLLASLAALHASGEPCRLSFDIPGTGVPFLSMPMAVWAVAHGKPKP